MNDPNTIPSIYIPLRLTYGLVPIVAGLDKFTNLLVHWEKYLPNQIASLLPVTPATFMLVVGVIEIVAGLAVLTVLTRLGAYVVMAWLLLIAGNLVIGGYYDFAGPDIVMAIGAFVLGQAAAVRGEAWVPGAASNQRALNHVAAH